MGDCGDIEPAADKKESKLETKGKVSIGTVRIRKTILDEEGFSTILSKSKIRNSEAKRARSYLGTST